MDAGAFNRISDVVELTDPDNEWVSEVILDEAMPDCVLAVVVSVREIALGVRRRSRTPGRRFEAEWSIIPDDYVLPVLWTLPVAIRAQAEAKLRECEWLKQSRSDRRSHRATAHFHRYPEDFLPTT